VDCEEEGEGEEEEKEEGGDGEPGELARVEVDLEDVRLELWKTKASIRIRGKRSKRRRATRKRFSFHRRDVRRGEKIGRT
jgi:hypothetical protein